MLADDLLRPLAQAYFLPLKGLPRLDIPHKATDLHIGFLPLLKLNLISIEVLERLMMAGALRLALDLLFFPLLAEPLEPLLRLLPPDMVIYQSLDHIGFRRSGELGSSRTLIFVAVY